MAFTEKNLFIERYYTIEVLEMMADGHGKVDINSLKFKINKEGLPVLYIKKHGKKTGDPLPVEELKNVCERCAKTKAEKAEDETAKKQTFEEEMKKHNAMIKAILKRAEVAQKEYEAKLEKKNIDTSKKEWYTDIGSLFDE